MNVIASLLFGLLLILVVLWNLLLHRLLHCLRTDHEHTYEELGRPHVIMNNTIRTALATVKFIIGEGAGKVGDPHVVRLARSMKRIFLGTIVVLVLALVMIALRY